MDANTIPEEIEYWEIRSGPGESVVVSGRKDVRIIQALRHAKGRPVRLSLEPPEPSADAHEE